MRRWRRRLLVAGLLAALSVIALPAAVAKGARSLTAKLARRPDMRKLIPFAAILALVLAGGATLASASSTSAAQALTLTAVVQPKTEVYVDTGRKGDSEGDGVIFGEVLRRDGKAVGRSSILCVFAKAATRCSGTLWIPGGTIEAGGGIRDTGKTFSVPVLGGTGRYAGARGVLSVTEVADRRSRYVIELED